MSSGSLKGRNQGILLLSISNSPTHKTIITPLAKKCVDCFVIIIIAHLQVF